MRRVFPDCVAQSQAVAFNMFLALFPMMLLVLGLVASSLRLRAALIDIVNNLRVVLPPGAEAILTTFLARKGTGGWEWILLGLGGTLFAGTQTMRLILVGFEMVYGGNGRIRFWHHNLRALLLLVLTIAPWLLTAYLMVFGKQLRSVLIASFALPGLFNVLWAVVSTIVALVLALTVLAVIYHIGRPDTGSWAPVFPGSALAMLLWWLVSWSLGVYIRSVPYGAIYGGLAVVIGLMLWFQLTATIIFIGAAYNAESATDA